MQKLRIETPRMYGDHHVTAVRRLLFELPGVIEIYASSCFAIVEIDYDPALLGPAELQAALEAGGYTEPLSVPRETGTPAYQEPANTLFRHTTMYRQLGRLIGFAQDVGANASVEWPCPGFGMTAEMEAEESDNG